MEPCTQRARRLFGRCVLIAWAALAIGAVLAGGAREARAADRIYWANNNGGVPAVSFANLDGTGGGGNLDTSGTGSANGLALNPSGGKAFWGSNGFTISFANLDGT